MAEDSEEVYLSEPDSAADLDTPMSGEEEFDANVHDAGIEDFLRADDGSEVDADEHAGGSAVAAIAHETAAAAAAAATQQHAAANGPSALHDEPSAAAEGTTSQPSPAPAANGADAPAATADAAAPTQPPAEAAAAGAPKGLGGLGLKPPAPRPASTAANSDGQAAGEQQQQAEQQQQQSSAAPKGLGLGGLGPKLPPKPSQATAADANKQPAATSSGPSLPAKPAGGLGLLPPKNKPAAAAASSSSNSEQQQQQQPAKPVGGVGGLPAKQPAGGLPALGPRPAAGGSSTSSSTTPAVGGTASGSSGGGSSFRPVLPGRPAAAGSTTPAVRPSPVVAARGGTVTTAATASGVVDADEPKSMQKLRQQIQDLRVNLIRAAVRLGLSANNEQLGQYLGVLERLEKVQAPSTKARADVNKLAIQQAMELNDAEGPDSRLGTDLRILVVGMTGTGKSELINSILDKPVLGTSAFRESTKRIRVVKGTVAGVNITCIDTPGLHASSDAQMSNRSILKGIKRVYNRRKPHFMLYVDRLDAARPGFGEMGVLTTISSMLGQPVWKKTMVVLTHANAAREKLGKEYPAISKQRRNILQNILRQAAGEMQLRTPFHLVDLHPEGPRSQSGQPIIFDQVGMLSLSAVPWRQNLLVMLLGLYAYETAQQLLQKKAAKGKSAAAKQQDMFRQMMRSRLPPTNYFVEQLVEGVTKPDGWAVPEDPFGAETDDEEAEDFRAMYYKMMFSMAMRGDLRAQKEYAAWLRKLERAKKAYKEAYDNEELETLAAYGYEGYVAEGLDLGPTFDPEDVTDHRYQYVITDNPVSIMPTLDYYGYEHEDAITGFVAEYSAQPFNRDGWGGYPVDITATIEKDKTNTCLQAEASTSIVHSTAAFGSRHITQIAGAFELLRPNVKDILYTLEVNTYKDGLLKGNDHAGCGMLVTRMAEGGNIKKGPVGVGVRMQETMRVGPFKVEAVAAQVRGETPMGGKDEGWGARAFVLYDYIPGLAMNFDWYQERTKDDSSTIGGWATSMAYDFDLPGGYPAGVELDWVAGSDVVHLDMNVFSAKDWKLSWLLLVPAVNYAKDFIRRLRSRKGDEELVEEEEEDDGGAGGMDLQSMLQGMSGPEAQQMLQQLMQSGQLQQLMGGRMG